MPKVKFEDLTPDLDPGFGNIPTRSVSEGVTVRETDIDGGRPR